MKRAFTLIELVFVVLIVALLSVATFKGIEALVVRSFKAKELTRLSLESQIALDQLSSLLVQRIPSTAIGYDPSPSSGADAFLPLDQIDPRSRYKVLEWIGRDFDHRDDYSGFVDMEPSRATADTLYTDSKALGERELYFAGSFDVGEAGGKDAFGWHGHAHNLSFDVDVEKNAITITQATKPRWIYERYFLAKSAYAVARGADVKRDAACLKDLDVDEDTLLLFYGFRPWSGETFCADPKGSGQAGKVSVLARNVAGFGAFEQDYTIRLIVDINKTIRGSDVGVHFSKMKVVF